MNYATKFLEQGDAIIIGNIISIFIFIPNHYYRLSQYLYINRSTERIFCITIGNKAPKGLNTQNIKFRINYKVRTKRN